MLAIEAASRWPRPGSWPTGQARKPAATHLGRPVGHDARHLRRRGRQRPRASPCWHPTAGAWSCPATVQGNWDLWLLDGTRMTRITFDAARDDYPQWSPDGTRIVFRSNRTGSGDLYQKLLTGADPEQLLFASDQLKVPTSWSADGRFLLYLSIDPQTNADLWVLPMTGDPDRTPWVFLQTDVSRGLWRVLAGRPLGRLPLERIGAARGLRATVCRARSHGNRRGSGWRRAASVDGGRHLSRMATGRPGAVLPESGRRDDGGVDHRHRGARSCRARPRCFSATRIYRGGTDVQQGRQYDVAPDGRFLINTELDDDAARRSR